MKNIKFVRAEATLLEYKLNDGKDGPWFVRIEQKDLNAGGIWYYVVLNRDVSKISNPNFHSSYSVGYLLYFRSVEAAEMCAESLAEEHFYMMRINKVETV